MNQKILQRLIWKDARTLKPLAIATPLAIVGFFMLTGVFASLSGVGDTEQMSLAYAIWFLLPLLLAYGAPAVLVGGEEESGSLAWLQTLPASWRSIAGSKLLATSVCLLLAWAVGTICYMLYWSSIGDVGLDRMRRTSVLPEPFWLHFAGAFSLSVALMLSSFTTAYLIRSPITALIAVVPLMIAMAYGTFFLAFLTLPVEQQQSSAGGIGRATFMAFALSVILAILLLLMMSFWAAWRRLERPESSLSQRVGGKFASDAFRPPQAAATSAFVGSMTAGRPGRLTALLWQQIWPIRWYLGLLTVAAIVGVLVTQLEVQLFTALGLIVSVLSVFVIASLTFYGDSVRKRCVFLSDRGISPTRVWITRVGPTLSATVIVFLVAAVVLMFHYSDVAARADGIGSLQWDISITNWFAVGIAGFALSQLVSQWSPRPALAFFAGPVFVHFAAFALAALFIFYVNATTVLFVSAAILFFASWKLMPKWMAVETGRGYVGPFLGYIMLAVLLPYVLVLGGRWITTPSERTAWRNQMLSMELAEPEDGAEKVAILNPAFVRRIEALATSSFVDREGQEDRVARELAATETIGEHIAFKELLQIITRVPDYRLEFHQDFAPGNRSVYMTPKIYPDTEPYQSVRKSQFDAVRLLAKWSRITREQAVVGDATFYILFGVAENADRIASRVLTTYVDQQGLTPEISELVALIPDEKLVRLSRRNSLIRSWKNYQAIGGRFAGDYPRPPSQWWLAVERTRSARNVDELTVAMLDQWDSGQDFRTPEALDKISTLAAEAYLDNPSVGSSFYQNLDLSERLLKTVETDRLMRQLRRKL